MRWQAEDGTVWASRFEYAVYSSLRERGVNVRRATAEDRLVYTHAVRNGVCKQCGSHSVVTERTYTPDLFIHPAARTKTDKHVGYLVEAKGYLRGDRRALLRSVRKAWPNVDLRLVIQRDYPVGKSTLAGWATKYLKVPVHVWNGDIPEDWK
jgi:hypothetical protein